MMTQLATRTTSRRALPSTAPVRQRPVQEHEQRKSDLAELLDRFAPISLAQMDDVALLDRIDTKYILHSTQLSSMLAMLNSDYRVLEISGVRMHRYHTLYFDTTDFELYRQHHVGLGNRYKVRSRQYVDSGLNCLEVKLKTNTARTVKDRLRTATLVTGMEPAACEFLSAHLPFDSDQLVPRLENDFLRITLVSRAHDERLTLDVDLRFSTDTQSIVLPGIVVAEVKRASRTGTSPFVRLMRQNHVRTTGFSKYCIGACLLYPELKHNNFKAQLRKLHSLVQGGMIGSS